MKKLLLMLALVASSNVFAKTFIRFEARDAQEIDQINQLVTDNSMLMYVETAQELGKMPSGGYINIHFDIDKNSQLPEMTDDGKKITKIRFPGNAKVFQIKDGYTYIFRIKPCAAVEHTLSVTEDKVNFCVQEIKSDEDKSGKEQIKNHHKARSVSF